MLVVLNSYFILLFVGNLDQKLLIGFLTRDLLQTPEQLLLVLLAGQLALTLFSESCPTH